MPAIKAISGHTGFAAARRYLERDGRALARDLLHFSRMDESPRQAGLEEAHFDWDAAMDETRRTNGNDVPRRGRPARTYKHYVLSPDPRDGVSLADLRGLAVRWADESFPDFQVAIVYHDDNDGHVPHAHVIVNNTNLATGNRLRDPDPGLLNGRLQAIARDMGLSHFEGRIDARHPDTRKRGSRENYQRVHVGRAEAELSSRGAYSWVAGIRSRVDVNGATRWMSVGCGLADVSRLEDVRSALDDGPSDLPALSAWAYRTGLSIPEVAGDDPRDAAGRVCAWAGVPTESFEFMSRVRATVTPTSDPAFGGAS